MGSMGEEAPQDSGAPAVGPASKDTRPDGQDRPYKPLSEWHRLFPSLTRTQDPYATWSKSEGESS